MVDDLIDILHGILIQLHVGFLPFFSFVGSPSSNLVVGVLEMVHEVNSTLDSSICEFTYLFTVVSVPSSAVEFFIELKNKFGMNKIGKGISNIAGIVVVDRQIQEIDSLSMFFTNFFHQHLF